MVLTQLDHSGLTIRTYSFEFPYHYGSHSTEAGFWFGSNCISFPYHYGSHSTKDTSNATLGCIGVSIPLWFSLNALKKIRVGFFALGFHTTMVLTQLMACISTQIQRLSFHTTMVLTQHTVCGAFFQVVVEFPYHYGSYATEGETPR